MSKAKKIFTNIRVIIVLIAVFLAIVAIHPNPFTKGVAIRTVSMNSSAAIAGIESPKPTSPPMSRERVISINNQPINSVEDYYDIQSSLKLNRTIHIKTNKNLYKLITKPKIETTILPETTTQKITEQVFDKKLNKTINTTKTIKYLPAPGFLE